MRQIANSKAEDRKMLFRNTAAKMDLTEAIVEKDFWISYVLDYLFNRFVFKDKIAFKGGTSLSKAYNLVDRFSEDIDLILDWRVLGYSQNEPWIERSKTKQDAFNKEANERTELFIKEKIFPILIFDLNNELAEEIRCEIDEDDRQTIRIIYPSIFSDNSVLQEIRLEIGALAAWSPAKYQKITSYAAIYYRQLFKEPITEVLTVLPERTFWEKITILHKEAHRPEDRELPSRYSRHYYDLYKMMQTSIKWNAIKDKDLLTQVVLFKDKFYHCSWARYDLAKFGSIKLLPPGYNLEKLEDDYKKMQNMLYGRKPSFDEIIKALVLLENDINKEKISN